MKDVTCLMDKWVVLMRENGKLKAFLIWKSVVNGQKELKFVVNKTRNYFGVNSKIPSCHILNFPSKIFMNFLFKSRRNVFDNSWSLT